MSTPTSHHKLEELSLLVERFRAEIEPLGFEIVAGMSGIEGQFIYPYSQDQFTTTFQMLIRFRRRWIEAGQ